MDWLCRFLPCCHTYTSVCGLGCDGSHLHHNLLLLWAAVVEHLAASHRSLVHLVLPCLFPDLMHSHTLCLCNELMYLSDGGCMLCRWHSECVTNNNGDTGFVTALIFSVVTEQTIGALAWIALSLLGLPCHCCIDKCFMFHYALSVLSIACFTFCRLWQHISKSVLGCCLADHGAVSAWHDHGCHHYWHCVCTHIAPQAAGQDHCNI